MGVALCLSDVLCNLPDIQKYTFEGASFDSRFTIHDRITVCELIPKCTLLMKRWFDKPDQILSMGGGKERG